MLSFVAFLLCLLNIVLCFTPNCVPENQFKFYRFPVEGCSEIFKDKCKSHPSGYFKSLGDTPLVKIGETEVLPTCAFYSATNLKRIYGVNSKIRVLATGSFTDLPSLEGIHLAFNDITELRNNVFKNVSVEMLDLSWNRIVFVDSHALEQIRNLKSLNLTKNSLVTVSLNSLPNTLNSLNLAYNLLTRIALNSNKFQNLTSMDFSNNLIEKIAILFSYPVEEIDLTSNRVKDFDFVDLASVSKFKIGKNHFENVPRYLESLNAKEIDLYPNPWKCDQLFLLWESLVSFNIRLAPQASGKNPPAECFTDGGNRLVTATRSNTCSEDHECAQNMVCRSKKCWDPCENEVCHQTSKCETKNHQLKCSCEASLLADPLDVHGACQDVDCFTDINCSQGLQCSGNKCIRRGGWGGGFGHHGTSHGGHGSSHGGGHGRPATTTYRPTPQNGIPQETFGPVLPWWYEDIPKLAPATATAGNSSI